METLKTNKKEIIEKSLNLSTTKKLQKILLLKSCINFQLGVSNLKFTLQIMHKLVLVSEKFFDYLLITQSSIF